MKNRKIKIKKTIYGIEIKTDKFEHEVNFRTEEIRNRIYEKIIRKVDKILVEIYRNKNTNE